MHPFIRARRLPCRAQTETAGRRPAARIPRRIARRQPEPASRSGREPKLRHAGTSGTTETARAAPRRLIDRCRQHTRLRGSCQPPPRENLPTVAKCYQCGSSRKSRESEAAPLRPKAATAPRTRKRPRPAGGASPCGPKAAKTRAQRLSNAAPIGRYSPTINGLKHSLRNVPFTLLPNYLKNRFQFETIWSVLRRGNARA